jgi:hypothetical protein
VASHAGMEFGTNQIAPRSGGTSVDATVDLGYFSLRWKDLYLSGGVYLGGTGAANKLDDYEEGTWTPGSYKCSHYRHDGWQFFLCAGFSFCFW